MNRSDILNATQAIFDAILSGGSHCSVEGAYFYACTKLGVDAADDAARSWLHPLMHQYAQAQGYKILAWSARQPVKYYYLG